MNNDKQDPTKEQGPNEGNLLNDTDNHQDRSKADPVRINKKSSGDQNVPEGQKVPEGETKFIHEDHLNDSRGNDQNK